jgi:hypothetical protein
MRRWAKVFFSSSSLHSSTYYPPPIKQTLHTHYLLPIPDDQTLPLYSMSVSLSRQLRPGAFLDPELTPTRCEQSGCIAQNARNFRMVHRSLCGNGSASGLEYPTPTTLPNKLSKLLVIFSPKPNPTVHRSNHGQGIQQIFSPCFTYNIPRKIK